MLSLILFTSYPSLYFVVKMCENNPMCSIKVNKVFLKTLATLALILHFPSEIDRRLDSQSHLQTLIMGHYCLTNVLRIFQPYFRLNVTEPRKKKHYFYKKECI